MKNLKLPKTNNIFAWIKLIWNCVFSELRGEGTLEDLKKLNQELDLDKASIQFWLDECTQSYKDFQEAMKIGDRQAMRDSKDRHSLAYNRAKKHVKEFEDRIA